MYFGEIGHLSWPLEESSKPTVSGIAGQSGCVVNGAIGGNYGDFAYNLAPK
jgi:hypothetical protein